MTAGLTSKLNKNIKNMILLYEFNKNLKCSGVWAPASNEASIEILIPCEGGLLC